MNKILKIQFWRAMKVLVMQVLKQEGLPKQKENGKVRIMGAPQLCDDRIFLRGTAKWDDLKIAHTHIEFTNQCQVNFYLRWVVDTITDELFTEGGELKVGEICEVRDDEDEQWQKRKLITILPKQHSFRFVVDSLEPHRYIGFEYARPIGRRTEPKIEECGNVVTYTWEEK